MSHGKQFTLFSHIGAPNGWKVAFVLNILGLSYETRYLEIGGNASTVKHPDHTKYNPNGRIPTLIDHFNKDLAIWESGAVILYLLDKYDTEHKISVASANEKAILVQWLFFQATGQGPYFGQAAWFSVSHPEKLPSAIERYRNETRRVLGVLESVLGTQDWLVGGKLTAADIVFVPYDILLKGHILEDDFEFQKEFPRVFAWHSRVIATEGVKIGLEERLRLVTEAKAKKAKSS